MFIPRGKPYFSEVVLSKLVSFKNQQCLRCFSKLNEPIVDLQSYSVKSMSKSFDEKCLRSLTFDCILLYLGQYILPEVFIYFIFYKFSKISNILLQISKNS